MHVSPKGNISVLRCDPNAIAIALRLQHKKGSSRRLRNDCKVIALRLCAIALQLRCDWAAIALRFRSDFIAIAMRMCYDCVAIAMRLPCDCDAIALRL
jgi:hypothetical protein